MANPTLAEIQAQVSGAALLLSQTVAFATTNSPNLLDLQDAVEQSLEGDWTADIATALANIRGSVNSACAAGPALLTPLVQTLGKFIDCPEKDVPSIFRRWRQYAIDNNIIIQSRQFTFGAPAADPGNAGDGAIHRLNVDKDGYPIESQHADSKVATCVSDSLTGATQHQEGFEFRGGDSGKDEIELTGSGAVETINALSAADTDFVENPSFESYTGDDLTDPTSIDGWAVSGSIANFEISEDPDDIYRGYGGIDTPRSAKFLADDALWQELGGGIPTDVPIYTQVAYKPEATVSGGTITLRMGTQTASALLASGAGGWNILRIPVGIGCWFDGFNEEGAVISIEISGLAGGSVFVDDVICARFAPFDGSWYAVVGARTPFLRNDFFDWTDTEVGAVIQEWLFRAFGIYWPSGTGGAVTWPDPTP